MFDLGIRKIMGPQQAEDDPVVLFQCDCCGDGFASGHPIIATCRAHWFAWGTLEHLVRAADQAVH
jgi:hypothetical protein